MKKSHWVLIIIGIIGSFVSIFFAGDYPIVMVGFFGFYLLVIYALFTYYFENRKLIPELMNKEIMITRQDFFFYKISNKKLNEEYRLFSELFKWDVQIFN